MEGDGVARGTGVVGTVQAPRPLAPAQIVAPEARAIAPFGTAEAARARRSWPDQVARKVLLVPDRSNAGQVYNVFSSSIMLSATRCLLAYIVFPLLGGLGALPLVGPAIGLPVGAAALVFDVRAIRRFFVAEHRWRWAAAALYLTVMAMVSYLVARDISRLA